MKIVIINGPNLNFLGIREKEVYGTKDYNDLIDIIKSKAASVNVDVDIFQSNFEGGIIDRIQKAYLENADGVIINPGAYTHYSYAIHDALKSIQAPVIEVHLSNIYKREEFRKHSVTAPACTAQIAGLGFKGYELAIDAILDLTAKK